MALQVKEVTAKSILTPSKIYPWVINPYTGCQHGCSYCYARFIKRVTGHKEPWGEFVDVKINAPELLEKELRKKKRDRVWVSGVCDPYQPLEEHYRLTRQCLEILARNQWPVVIQTRSPLVIRDLYIIRDVPDFEVGFSIPTADDNIRKILEPHAPPIGDRLAALDTLHRAGVRTFAMVAPVLPGADGLADLLRGKIDYIIIDRMHYHYADRIYREHGLEYALGDGFFYDATRELRAL